MDSKHELIIPNDNLPFKLFLFEGGSGNYKRASHWHRSIEIFLVTEGRIDFFLGENHYPIGERDFIIVNSNEVHSIGAPFPNRTLVLQIPVQAFEPYLKEQPYLSFSKRSGALNEKLMALVMEMHRTYEEKGYAWELKVNGLFEFVKYLLLTEFKDQAQAPDIIRQKIHLDKLSEITEYMKNHYDEELSLEKVADRFGFSPTYLSRIFKRYANISYRDYLQDLRVEYAVKEMVHTSHELGDIAVNHGFADSRALAKAFGKRYGCLPSEYRRRLAVGGKIKNAAGDESVGDGKGDSSRLK